MRMIAVLFLALASLPSARAFTLNYSDSVEGWAGNELTVAVNYTNCPISQDKLNSAIDQAIDLWNSVPGTRMTLKRGGISSFSGATPQTPPFIACDTNFSADTGKDGNSVGGVTFAVPVSGKQLGAGYMVLNAEVGKSSNISKLGDTLLAVLLAHEMGHLLGLGHSADKEALMYFDLSGKTQVRLSQDDIDGIDFLYPRSEIGQNGVFGCGSIAAIGGPGSNRPPSGEKGIPPTALEMSILLGFCAAVAYAFRGKWKRSTGLASIG